MTFAKGQIVTVVPFKRDGTITEVLKDGSYKVTLGNLVVTVTEDQLKASSKRNSKTGVKNDAPVTIVSTTSQTSEKEDLDLHGCIVNDAIAMLEQKLNRAALAKLHRVRVVHGLGSGKVKEAVHAYLSTCSIVESYKLDEWNAGVTWVYL